METPPPHEKWRSRSGHRLYTKKHSSFFFFSGWCMNGEHSRRQSLAGTGPLMKRGPGQGRPLVIDVPPLSDCSWWRTHSAGRHHRRCLGSGRLAGVSSFKTVPYCTGLPPRRSECQLTKKVVSEEVEWHQYYSVWSKLRWSDRNNFEQSNHQKTKNQHSALSKRQSRNVRKYYYFDILVFI